MLDGFLSVLGEPRTGIEPWGYEFVEGLLDGRPARVSLIPDSLITRTLPTLWLEARWASRHDAWLCVIAQCNGMEYFSDDVDEGQRLDLSSDWPDSTVARGKVRRAACSPVACARSTSRPTTISRCSHSAKRRRK